VGGWADINGWIDPTFVVVGGIAAGVATGTGATD